MEVRKEDTSVGARMKPVPVAIELVVRGGDWASVPVAVAEVSTPEVGSGWSEPSVAVVSMPSVGRGFSEPVPVVSRLSVGRGCSEPVPVVSRVSVGRGSKVPSVAVMATLSVGNGCKTPSPSVAVPLTPGDKSEPVGAATPGSGVSTPPAAVVAVLFGKGKKALSVGMANEEVRAPVPMMPVPIGVKEPMTAASVVEESVALVVVELMRMGVKKPMRAVVVAVSVEESEVEVELSSSLVSVDELSSTMTPMTGVSVSRVGSGAREAGVVLMKPGSCSSPVEVSESTSEVVVASVPVSMAEESVVVGVVSVVSVSVPVVRVSPGRGWSETGALTRPGRGSSEPGAPFCKPGGCFRPPLAASSLAEAADEAASEALD